MLTRRTVLALLFALGASNAAYATLIINGDFETNTLGGTAFNMTNAAFTAAMGNATGFGTAEELDSVTGLDFGIAPQSGDWKIGMHTQSGGPFDAFSLDLSSSTIVGNTYDLSFYTAGLAGFGTGLVNVQIGLSTSATSFGTLVASGIASDAESWTLISTSFTASTAAPFLTVRTDPSVLDGYAFVDNFSLTPAVAAPEPTSLVLLALGLLGLGARRRRH